MQISQILARLLIWKTIGGTHEKTIPTRRNSSYNGENMMYPVIRNAAVFYRKQTQSDPHAMVATPDAPVPHRRRDILTAMDSLHAGGRAEVRDHFGIDGRRRMIPKDQFNVGALARGAILALVISAEFPSCRTTKAFEHQNYSSTDARAVAAGAPAEASIPALAAYLTSGASDDEQKARAIFRWMAGRISYDLSALQTGRYGDNSAEGTLRSRKSVCEGYANLYVALATQAGLKVEKVTGYAKGYGYSAGSRIEGSNHAWVAVEIDGAWRLIDPTWGAGHIENGQFVHKLQDFYFMAPPDQMIYSHLPDDSRWQLLGGTVSKEEFSAMPQLRPGFFTLGVQIESPPGGRIRGESASLRLKHNSDVSLTGVVVETIRTDYPGGWSLQSRYMQLPGLTIEEKPDAFIVTGQVPRGTSAQTYTLMVFGARALPNGSFPASREVIAEFHFE